MALQNVMASSARQHLAELYCVDFATPPLQQLRNDTTVANRTCWNVLPAEIRHAIIAILVEQLADNAGDPDYYQILKSLMLVGYTFLQHDLARSLQDLLMTLEKLEREAQAERHKMSLPNDGTFRSQMRFFAEFNGIFGIRCPLDLRYHYRLHYAFERLRHALSAFETIKVGDEKIQEAFSTDKMADSS